jgi:hypothetical protein
MLALRKVHTCLDIVVIEFMWFTFVGYSIGASYKTILQYFADLCISVFKVFDVSQGIDRVRYSTGWRLRRTKIGPPGR